MITNSLLDKPEVRGIVINTRDITKRKRAEEALRENEELLDSILTASAVGIAYARDREIIWANDAMAKLFGFDSIASLMSSASTFIEPRNFTEYLGIEQGMVRYRRSN